MPRKLGAAATAVAAAVSLGPSVPAALARSTGDESFSGTIVAAAKGGKRTVIASTVFATGVFNGAGRIVEVPNRSGDPEIVLRDDLVFPQGRMHLLSEEASPPQFTLNRRTCVYRFTVRQTGRIAGGTGMFANASGTFTSTVRGWGVGGRRNGACSQEAPPLLETDIVTARGTLTV